jgi:F0F1-type ATP synthase assembly protein I
MVSQLSRFDEHFVIRDAEFTKKPGKKTSQSDLKKIDPHLMNAGMYILTPILLGLAVGYFADQYFHTKPVLLIVFLLAGTVSSFYNLFKLAKKS